MMADDLVYRSPPKKEEVVRRVYVLPVSLVKRIHDFGYKQGHPTEVSAVRALIERALSEAGDG